MNQPMNSALTNILAYLDPGTGSFLLQLLIAASAGMLIYAGISWRKIKKFLTRKKSQPKDQEEDEDDEQNDD
jgi:hypothetical protein